MNVVFRVWCFTAIGCSSGINSKQEHDRDEEGLTGSLTRENFFFSFARCFALSHFVLARCKKKKEAKGGREGGGNTGKEERNKDNDIHNGSNSVRLPGLRQKTT